MCRADALTKVAPALSRQSLSDVWVTGQATREHARASKYDLDLSHCSHPTSVSESGGGMAVVAKACDADADADADAGAGAGAGADADTALDRIQHVALDGYTQGSSVRTTKRMFRCALNIARELKVRLSRNSGHGESKSNGKGNGKGPLPPPLLLPSPSAEPLLPSPSAEPTCRAGRETSECADEDVPFPAAPGLTWEDIDSCSDVSDGDELGRSGSGRPTVAQYHRATASQTYGLPPAQSSRLAAADGAEGQRASFARANALKRRRVKSANVVPRADPRVSVRDFTPTGQPTLFALFS